MKTVAWPSTSRVKRLFSTYVVAAEVVNGGLGQHGVVLQLGLAERRSVASDDDKLGLAGTESLESRLVTQGDFTALHPTWLLMSAHWQNRVEACLHKRQARGERVGILLALLNGHCVCW